MYKVKLMFDENRDTNLYFKRFVLPESEGLGESKDLEESEALEISEAFEESGDFEFNPNSSWEPPGKGLPVRS